MAADFQAALIARDLDAVRRVPKADLHNHFILGGDRAFLAERTGRDIAPLKAALGSMDQMHAWVAQATGGLFDSAEGRFLAFEAAFVQAARDGVTRLEVGEDVWAITLNGGSAARLTAALEAARRSSPSVEWVRQLGLSRHCPPAALDRWLEPFLALGTYQTLDLYGDEFAQPIEAFKPIYRRAKEAGLRLKAHVGEWGTADDVWRAVETLNLDEVQHGIAAASSPACMRFLADSGVRLNICPTSNVMLGRVESLADHPIGRLYDAGVRVSVNTDDVLVFGRSVSEEFLGLYDAGVLAAEALERIRLDAFVD